MAFLPDEAVVQAHQISPKAFLLYAHYCRFRDHKTGKAFPKLKTLGELLHTSKSTVCELRQQLVSEGWLILNGDEATLIKGFASPEIPNEDEQNRSEKTNDHSEIPNEDKQNRSEKTNDHSEIPNEDEQNRSEKTNDHSEIPNASFGNSECHIGRTSPINQPIEPKGEGVSFPHARAHESEAPAPDFRNSFSLVHTPAFFDGEDKDQKILEAARANRNPHSFHRLTDGSLVEVMPTGRELIPLENALRIACRFPPAMLKAQAIEIELAAKDFQKSYGEVDLNLLVRAGEYYDYRKRKDYTASWIAVDWGKIKAFLEDKQNGTGSTTAAKLGATIDARSRFSRSI